MKNHILLSILLLFSFFASAQTQQGFVKTKGRMDAKGKLIPGQGLKGATVSVQGRSTVLVNNDNGAFSFPVTNDQFRLDSVRKKGYRLVDMDACPRSYKYSSNPLYIVMETPEQQLQDQLAAERKIRRNLQKQLQERENEIEAMKEQQSISDEEYRLALQKLYKDQESNEQLISDMAKRYSELDYDQLDEFYRQVSYFIENGELLKADSLLKTRGDIIAQVADIKQRGQAILQEKEQIQKAESVHQADIEEAARRCYGYYETFAAQHLNDSAAYYLYLRASLDTTNGDWQHEAGEFITEYIADYSKALEYHEKALAIWKAVLGEDHPNVARSYNNIGFVYHVQGDYAKALEYYEKALAIQRAVLGENHPDVARSYNNIGCVYDLQGDYDYAKALEYHEKALAIQRAVLGENHPDVAISYNNIGCVYYDQGDYAKALEYYEKALDITVLGENHPDVARSYNNIGSVYNKQGDYEKALEYYNKALTIWEESLGPEHQDTKKVKDKIAEVQSKMAESEK